ncbi:MAG: efflux RND transporter periplasmic adaptor subunit [Desulfuromonadaceae bacterium]|nr:efflux RND transporter periplasmic adaptor subunit [Desulfuromonadaceae bacterium]
MTRLKSKTRHRAAKGILILCLTLLLIAAALNWLFASSQQENPLASLQTATVERGDLEVTVACTGSLKAVGTVEVGTEVSGTIKKVLADYNDRVVKGQILAELDLELFEAEAVSARAATLRANALLQQAQTEYRRNQPLLQQGHLSAQEFLAYQTNLATAEADLMAAEASQKKAETNLRNASIRSPIDGTVIEREIEKGQTVAANFSTPTLFILAEDLARMEIEADVDESDIGQIKQGQQVRFTVQAYAEKIFPGTVTQIRLNPTEESHVVTYTVVITAANDKSLLLPGMTATIDFIIQDLKNTLLAPNAALQYATRALSVHDGAALVVVDDQGRSQTLAVTAGPSNGAHTAVTGSNLIAGLTVVTGTKTPAKQSSGNLFSRLMPRPPGRGK